MTDPEELPSELLQRMRLDAESGPARAIDEAAAARLVDATLAQWTAEGVATDPGRPRRRPVVLLATVALGLGIGSAAAFYAAQGGWAEPSAAPTSVEPKVVAPPVAQPGLPPAMPETQEPEQVPPAEAKPAPRRTKTSPAPVDLLARANELRGKARYSAAEQTYLRVVRAQPRGSAGYVARVAAADLRLQHLNDPKGALGLYRQALRAPSAALSIEAHMGVAKCERALGRPSAERTALQGLLTKHPQGPSADWARRRLQALNDAR